MPSIGTKSGQKARQSNPMVQGRVADWRLSVVSRNRLGKFSQQQGVGSQKFLSEGGTRIASRSGKGRQRHFL
jgi:hypothetical protein